MIECIFIAPYSFNHTFYVLSSLANIVLKINQYYHGHQPRTVSNCISNLTPYTCTYQTFYHIYCGCLYCSFYHKLSQNTHCNICHSSIQNSDRFSYLFPSDYTNNTITVIISVSWPYWQWIKTPLSSALKPIIQHGNIIRITLCTAF